MTRSLLAVLLSASYGCGQAVADSSRAADTTKPNIILWITDHHYAPLFAGAVLGRAPSPVAPAGLVACQAIATNAALGGAVQFFESSATNYPQRYYRGVTP